MSQRQIKALNMAGVKPAESEAIKPIFEWVDPATLLVNESYQRNLSERSVALIRRIVSKWDWRKFKPPVVARTSEGLEVIDGQHTATAAVSHPGIDMIPVMVIEADEQAKRADAFLGHNRDRLAITPMQMHAAAVAAGDEDAMTIEQVCERAGVKVLRYPPGNGAYRPGETVAIAAIRSLIRRRGVIKARQALQVLVDAKCSPVSQAYIRAVELLLYDSEYAEQITSDDLVTVIIDKGFVAEQEAKIFAAAHSVPLWKALAVTLFKGARRGRRRAA